MVADHDDWPEPFASDIEAKRGLAYQLVEASPCSKVDWRAQGLEGLGRPDGFHERQVDCGPASSTASRAASSRLRRGGGVARARSLLDYVPGLMHGDLQFANVVFGHGAPAWLVAIVDWEMGTVGDPKLDLGWVVHSWPEDMSSGGSVAGYVDMTGHASRTQILELRGGVGSPGRRHRLLLGAGQVEARRGARGRLPASRRRPQAASVRRHRPPVMGEAADLAETSDYRG
ncbi:MAG: phosphotransferase [Acidimicrobiales bacterium]